MRHQTRWMLLTVAIAGLAAGCATDPAAAPSPTPTSAATPTQTTEAEGSFEVNMAGLRADPNHEAALARGGSFLEAAWDETDFRFHTVPYDEIRSGGVGRDGIPPIDNPSFVSLDSAGEWLEPQEPVIALEVQGSAKAYPLQVLTWHEIVNDTIADVPVAVTFCPLCNSAVVFDRRLDGTVYDFGVSGNLRNSDLIMWDRQTESWWQQLTGEGIVGDLAGAQLEFIAAQIVSWESFQEAHPNGQVLSRDTGFSRDYGRNPYAGYDDVGNSPFLFDGENDDRLLPMERVAAVSQDGDHVAYPFSVLQDEQVVNDEVGGTALVVFHQPGTVSALDDRRIADSRDVGATGVFSRDHDGQTLTFAPTDDPQAFVDNETGSTWNIFGEATAGPLQGAQLDPIIHQDHFWFAWAAFRPDTTVYRRES